jgi:superoxide dismutase, Fe-Mn family
MYSALPGVISEKALSEHLKLFNGYKEMLERADESQLLDPKPSKPTLDHQYRLTMWAQSYAYNGVQLHDLFFRNLSLNPGKPDSKLLSILEDQFGDVYGLYKSVKDVALISRGWAVVGQNHKDQSIRLFSIDSHEEGNAFGFNPILVIDAWEHAYWMDWGTNKAGYIDALAQYIDWSEVSRRLI